MIDQITDDQKEIIIPKQEQPIKKKRQRQKREIKQKKKKSAYKDESYYNVEYILDRKKIKSREFFLVKWYGYDEATWEPRSNLQNIKELLFQFVQMQTEKLNQFVKENGENLILQPSTSQKEIEDLKNTSLFESFKKQFKENQKLNSPIAKQKSANDQLLDTPQTVRDGQNQNITSSTQSSKKHDDEDESIQNQQFTSPKKQVENIEQIEQSEKLPQVISPSKDVKHEQQKTPSVSEDDNKSEIKKQNQQTDQIKTNSSNKKRKNSEVQEQPQGNQEEVVQENLQRSQGQTIQVQGNIDDHIPLDISKAFYKDQKFQYRVEWKQSNGAVVLPSLVPSQILLQRYGDLIVRFYEDKALKRK